MGYYINPPKNESKEDWLKAHGFEVDKFKDFDDRPEYALPVCLVDNNGFTAAGVAFDAREQAMFIAPSDKRPKRYFYVHIDDLKDVQALPRSFVVGA